MACQCAPGLMALKRYAEAKIGSNQFWGCVGERKALQDPGRFNEAAAGIFACTLQIRFWRGGMVRKRLSLKHVAAC